MRIVELIWTEDNVEHIAAHGVTLEEFEEVVEPKPLWRRGRRHPETGRTSLYALGQTEAGRYLFLVLSPRDNGRAYPVTAMDMDETARAYYKAHRKGN
jgi:uncharacterized DUF497 family protein